MLDAGVRACLAAALAMAGRFEEAREHILAASPLLDQPLQTDFSLQSRWTIAEALECAGDLAGAERELAAAFLSMRDARGAGPEARALRIAAQLALLLCDQGRWDEAAGLPRLRRGGRRSRADPGQDLLLVPLRRQRPACGAARRVRRSAQLVRQAVEVADRCDWLNVRARVWLALAEVARTAGRTAEADDAVATALALYEQKGNVAAAARLRAQHAGRPEDVDLDRAVR